MPLQPRTNQKKKRIIITAAIILGTALLVGGGYIAAQSNWAQENIFGEKANEEASTESERPVNSVDYSGPSQTDTDSSQDGKKNNDNSSETPNNAENISVAVSYADVLNDNVEIRAFIPGLIEGSGTCTATLKQGDLTVQASSKAFVDASSSQCEPIYIPLAKFSTKGKWILTISYKSSTHSGASETVEVTL